VEGVARVLEKYPDPEAIPERNIDTMNQLGVEQIQQILQQCLQAGGE
jgi:hypothetical protein